MNGDARTSLARIDASIAAKEQLSASIKLRTALEIARSPQRATWLYRPYLERNASILMHGPPGTFKSFLATHLGLEVARSGEHVLFLSAEGRGLWKRIRAWCAAHAPGEPWEEVLAAMRGFVAVEVPLNLSHAETLRALQTALDESFIRPSLVVVDTLSRFSDGRAEGTNEDAAAYLNQLDQALRVRYGASVLLIHHSGHSETHRARGASALSANTDASFQLERPDPQKNIVTVRSGRMKDCEAPPPFEIQAEVVTLDVLDEDGKPETSLAIRFTGNEPAQSASYPTGKNQRRLLTELERLVAEPGALGIWSIEDLRAIARGLDMNKGNARAAVLGLQQHRYFTPTVGGTRLTFNPSGMKGQNGVKSSDLTPAIEGQKVTRPLGRDHLSLPATLNGSSHQ